MLIDANKKRNVDFILQQDFKNPVPIEVGRGRKDKKQITHAINNYGADYGIIISDTITNIFFRNIHKKNSRYFHRLSCKVKLSNIFDKYPIKLIKLLIISLEY